MNLSTDDSLENCGARTYIDRLHLIFLYAMQLQNVSR